MAVFTGHNSWGRTRSPKNIAGAPGTAVTLTAVDGAITAFAGITAAAIGDLGHSTENQRYLHVLVEDEHAGEVVPGAVQVFGYCHAFLRWFQLPQSFDPVGANTKPTAALIPVPPDTGDLPVADDPSQRQYRTYHIVGVDRVAFVSATAGVTVYAACSTF